MAKVSLLDLNKKEVGDVEVSDKILETPRLDHLLKDSVVQYRASLRQGTHSTKTRKEVSGSTRKLFKQKGTGRARAGSIKSPIWRQGGIVFGPKPREYSVKLNKKVKVQAFRSAFAEKFRQGQVMVLDSLVLKSHKTRELRKILDELECSSVLIVVHSIDANLELASRNLANVHVLADRSLNVYELLRWKKIILVKESLIAIEERLSA